MQKEGPQGLTGTSIIMEEFKIKPGKEYCFKKCDEVFLLDRER